MKGGDRRGNLPPTKPKPIFAKGVSDKKTAERGGDGGGRDAASTGNQVRL